MNDTLYSSKPVNLIDPDEALARTAAQKRKSAFTKQIYRDTDFNISPICKTTKKPTVLWSQWQKERIPVATLCHWSKLFPGCNWAVICGAKPWSQQPGIVIVDADDGEAIALVRDRCPPTPLITTSPRGGEHHIYRYPDQSVRNRQGTTISGHDYKLDIRGDGGYALIPGSTKPDGRSYLASMNWTPATIASLPVYDPAWLPDERRECKRYGNRRHRV